MPPEDQARISCRKVKEMDVKARGCFGKSATGLIGAILLVAGLAPMVAAAEPRAVAEGFKESVIYHPPENPGFAAWVQLWREPRGDLMVKFIERRTPKVPRPQVIDVHKWETLGLPAVYNFSNLDTEQIYMRSTDGAKSWQEVSRAPERELGRESSSGLASPITLADGRMLGLTWGMPGCLRQSTDQGKTWTTVRELMDPKFYDVAPFSMRLLRDGKTLIIYCPYMHAWGPGTDRPTRLAGTPGVRTTYQGSIFWSEDSGKTLHGPIPMYPGVPVTETDFCELPSGDLLFVHHKMYNGTAHRQLVRRTKFGFVPEEMQACGLDAPEIFVRTREGYLVGASRNGPYYWSDDDALTWHAVEGAPACGYQPRALLLDDNRVLFTWHHGGDLAYKEADEWIGQHVFTLKVLQPRRRTRLRLERFYDAAQKRYICAFTATLTDSDGKPVANQPVEFSVVGRDEPGYEPFGGATPWVKGKITRGETDEKGVARVDYPEQQKVESVHKSFQVCARFNPDQKIAGFVPSTSMVMEYYAVTPQGKN
jgi:hypothetical protein